jgi:DNA-binding transcriptional LysR family regulator
MVERKLGIALLPRSAIAGELAAKVLVQVAVTDAPPVTQKMVVIRRRDQGRPSGTVAAFLTMLRQADPTELAS